MTIDEMRFIIRQKYNTTTWHTRVDKMPNNQVVAVYYSFLDRERKAKHHPATKPLFSTKKKPEPSKPVNDYKQMSLFDNDYDTTKIKGKYSFETKTESKELIIKDCHQIDMFEYLKSLEETGI